MPLRCGCVLAGGRGAITMTLEEALSLPPRVLTQDQRAFYHANGYLLLERLIDADTIARLNEVTDAFVERSRSHAKSDNTFDLAPGHSADRPKVRRLKRPDATVKP